AARRRDVDQAAVVGKARARPLAGGRGHGDHVVAVAGVEAADVGVVVAGGHHHGGAAVDRRVDRALVGGRAAAAPAQAHVDHLGRVAVGRHAADAAARGPDDGVGNVGQVAAAAAEDPDRHHLGAMGNAGHALVVVGDRGDRAGDMGAMPAGAVATVVVARIAGVRVTPVAIAGDGGVTDEVIARQHVGVEVAVVGDAGVEHRHHHAGAAGLVPGLVGADAAGGLEVVPLMAGVIGVVGSQGRVHLLVDLDVLHRRVGGQPTHQRLGIGAIQRTAGLQHFGARGGAAKLAQLQPGAVQGGGGGRLQGLRQGPLARVLGAALAVLHDGAVVRLGGLQCRGVDHRVGGREGG